MLKLIVAKKAAYVPAELLIRLHRTAALHLYEMTMCLENNKEALHDDSLLSTPGAVVVLICERRRPVPPERYIPIRPAHIMFPASRTLDALVLHLMSGKQSVRIPCLSDCAPPGDDTCHGTARPPLM